MDLFTVFAVLGALSLLFLLFSKWRYQYWARRGVPQLEPQLIFGDFKPIVSGTQSQQQYFLDLYKKCKANGWSQVGVYSFLSPEWMICDLAVLKNILIKDFEYFTDHGFYHNGNEPVTEHLFNMEGEEWKRLTPTFTTGKIKMMFMTLLEKANILKKVASQCADTEKEIQIKEILARFGTDVIGSVAFGIECNSLEEPNNKLREIGKMAFEPNLYKVFMEEMIPHHILGKLGYSSFSKQISTYFTDGNTLTEKEIIAQCFVFYIAGFETSSTTATFALLELSKNQDIQDKLRKEINDVLDNHDGILSYEAMMEMEYLEKVLHETLRKYPPVATIPRQCSKRYQVPGTDLVIEKGTRVHIPAWGIQKDPEYFSNPEEFNPENFSKENKSKRPDLSWIPFGEGPRICIGLRFGMMQSKIALISLLQEFRVSPHEKTKWPLKMATSSIVLSVKGDVWLKIDRL